MDDSAASDLPRSELLAELADDLGMPVIAIVSGWCGNNVTNLGEEGARAFLEVLEAEIDACSGPVESIGLFLVGRGGFACFADGVWRALTVRGIEATAIVPHRIDGAAGMLAASCQRRLMHPYGAVGAYDRLPLGRLNAHLDSNTLRGLEGLSEMDFGDRGFDDLGSDRLAEIACERRHAQMSRHLMRRMLGGSESGVGARVERQLCAEVLGAELGLSGPELDKLGLESTVADGRTAELIWQIYEIYERELEVLEVAMPRFTQSQVADEVEFAPATGKTGAVIEGVHDQLVFELDTGSPDPDTNMLKGEWLWDRSVCEIGVP